MYSWQRFPFSLATQRFTIVHANHQTWVDHVRIFIQIYSSFAADFSPFFFISRLTKCLPNWSRNEDTFCCVTKIGQHMAQAVRRQVWIRVSPRSDSQEKDKYTKWNESVEAMDTGDSLFLIEPTAVGHILGQ